jgi:hypothetical protein
MSGLTFAFDGKFIVVAALLAALVAVKFLAGNRPYDPIARRRRRFGPRGYITRERIANAPPSPPEDPERDFFGEGDPKP